MRSWIAPVLLSVLPSFASAADTTVTIGPIDYADPERVAANIRAECNLPKSLTDSLLKNLATLGVDATMAATEAAPQQGVHVLVRIEDAHSSGNAFIGHRKDAAASATLLRNGKEVSSKRFSRDSMGGFGAGYKGSCAVLHRCTNALGKDIAAWMQSEVHD